MSTTTARPGQAPGSAARRRTLTAMLAAAAVSGSLGTVAPAPPGQADTGASTQHVVRPNGDAPRFATTRAGASAASMLDDAVNVPTRLRSGDAIRATRAGASTSVVLGARIRSGFRPSAARAYFYAGTTRTSSLRVEVVNTNGAVLAATTIAPGRSMRWGSLAFRPPARSALNGLQLRFVAATGTGAEVRAAYARVTARSGPAVTLRPRRDVARLTVVPRSSAAAAIDDAADSPQAPSYVDRLRADAAGRSTTVDLADVPSTERIERVVAWYHARTGSGTRLRVEAVLGGRARAAVTLPSASAARWRAITVPVTTPAAVNGLQLRFTSVGGGRADVAAASVAVTVEGESFDAYLDRYAAGLPPLRAGEEKPAAPVGAAEHTVSEPLPDIDAPSGQSRFSCTTTPVEASSNPHKIVTLDPDGSKMWLGALLQGQAYAGGPGSLADLPATGKRAPIRIWTDLMGADVVRTVTDPDGAQVHQAVADLVRTAQAEGVPSPAVIAYDESSQSTVQEGLIKAGLSVKYLGGSGAASLRSERSAQRSSLLVSFTQRAFTVNLVRPNRFSDYFDGLTRNDLELMQAAGQIGPDNPPVVISNIAFGRVLYYSISSTAEQAELEAAVKASYEAGKDGASIELTARQKDILNQAEMKVLAMGGPTTGVENLIRTHKIQDYFAAENTLDRAVPISYQVDNLDGTPAAFTETTRYDLRECTAIDNRSIDVGDVIRISKPQFYLDASRSHADMFGSLSVNNVEFWNRTYDSWQTIQNHTLTNPTSTDPAVDRRVTWPLEVTLRNDSNPVARISGSVNCRLWFPEFGTGSNQYDWRYDSRSSAPGVVAVRGGSSTCNTLLRFQVTKVKDVLEYQP